jgi:hypothetical protein
MRGPFMETHLFGQKPTRQRFVVVSDNSIEQAMGQQINTYIKTFTSQKKLTFSSVRIKFFGYEYIPQGQVARWSARKPLIGQPTTWLAFHLTSSRNPSRYQSRLYKRLPSSQLIIEIIIMSSSSSPGTPPATIHDLLVGSTSETDSETGSMYTKEAAVPFCHAIVFYHSCGCRIPEPFFCCRPARKQQQQPSEQDPCQHENPALIIAILPHSCSLRIGNTEACSVEDPGAKEFVREVDTAETLDLVVLEPEVDLNIKPTLPERVAVGATAEDAASAHRLKRHALLHKPRISARAAPFVPRSFVSARPTPIGQPLYFTPNDSEVTKYVVKVVDIVAEVEGAADEDARVSPSNGVQPNESEEIEAAGTKRIGPPELTVGNERSGLGETTAEPERSRSDLLLFWSLTSDGPVEVVPPPTRNRLISFLTSRFSYIRS